MKSPRHAGEDIASRSVIGQTQTRTTTIEAKSNPQRQPQPNLKVTLPSMPSTTTTKPKNQTKQSFRRKSIPPIQTTIAEAEITANTTGTCASPQRGGSSSKSFHAFKETTLPRSEFREWKKQRLAYLNGKKGQEMRLSPTKHLPVCRDTQARCRIPGCSAKPYTACEFCGVHLCIKNGHFIDFHRNPLLCESEEASTS